MAEIERTENSGEQPLRLFQKDIPPRLRSQIGEMLGTMINFSISARSELETNLDYWDALYEMKVLDRDWPWEDCSNFVVPFIPEQVDSLAARLTGVVFQPRFFLVNGNTEQAAQAQHGLERYYNAELARHNWTDSFFDWLLLSLRDGCSVMEILWRKTTKTFKVVLETPETDALGQPVTDKNGEPVTRQEYQEVKLDTFDDVELTPIRLKDFLILPAWSTSIDSAAGVARMKLMDETELRSMQRGGIVYKDALDKLLAMSTPGRSDVDLAALQSSMDYTINDQIELAEDSQTVPGIHRVKGPFRVWRIHTDALDMDGDGEPEENVFYIHEQTRILLGFQRYSYWHMQRPFVELVPIPRPGRFYGKSVCELLRTVQEELNSIHNQRNDEISLRLSPPRYRLRAADVADQDNRWGPDAEWLVDTPTDVGIITLPDVPLSSWEEEQLLANYGQRITGLSNPMTGQQNSGRRTAKEVMQQVSAGNVRLDLMAARIRQASQKVFWQIHHLKKQFASETLQTTTMVQGMPQRLQLPREVLDLDFDLSIVGMGGQLDKQNRMQETMLVYSMLMQNPIVANNPLHIYSVTRMVLEEMGRPDIPSLIGTPEEIQQMMQQQQAAQAQQAQAAAMGQQPQQQAQPQQAQPQQPGGPLMGGAPPFGGRAA